MRSCYCTEVAQLTRLRTRRSPKTAPDYRRPLRFPNFTITCPTTGQLDFGSISVDYLPHRLSLDVKSFDSYLAAFRDVVMRREAAVNQILDDLIHTCHPRDAFVVGVFRSRDGFRVRIEARYQSSRNDANDGVDSINDTKT
jgi:7-cyano-7-deazaguanine reductase